MGKRYTPVLEFNTSIILPFFKKSEIFKIALEKNAKYFDRPGIEVIICMDECGEEEFLLEIIKLYSSINWKIYINRRSHGWRGPVKALNVGIRHAGKKNFLFIDPESVMLSDILYTFHLYSFHYPNCFFTGNVIFSGLHSILREKEEVLPYGSLFVKRKYIVPIKGYDESYTTWGGDDDNIRARLEMTGIKRIHVPEALLAHKEAGNSSGHKEREAKSDLLSLRQKQDAFYPAKHYANTGSWGIEFSESIYDYTQNH